MNILNANCLTELAVLEMTSSAHYLGFWATGWSPSTDSILVSSSSASSVSPFKIVLGSYVSELNILGFSADYLKIEVDEGFVRVTKAE